MPDSDKSKSNVPAVSPTGRAAAQSLAQVPSLEAKLYDQKQLYYGLLLAGVGGAVGSKAIGWLIQRCGGNQNRVHTVHL